MESCETPIIASICGETTLFRVAFYFLLSKSNLKHVIESTVNTINNHFFKHFFTFNILTQKTPTFDILFDYYK